MHNMPGTPKNAGLHLETRKTVTKSETANYLTLDLTL